MGVDVNTAFMSTQQTVELDTEYPVIPEGEYLAHVGPDPDKDLKLRSFEIKNGDRAGEMAYQLSLSFVIDDEDLRDEMGRDPKVYATIWLDFADPEQGVLKVGKGANVPLGRLRAALGQNDPSEPWAPPMMCGQSCYVTIKHRVHEGRVYSDVKDYRELD